MRWCLHELGCVVVRTSGMLGRTGWEKEHGCGKALFLGRWYLAGAGQVMWAVGGGKDKLLSFFSFLEGSVGCTAVQQLQLCFVFFSRGPLWLYQSIVHRGGQ